MDNAEGQKMGKKGFIRALWGVHEDTHRVLARRFRTDNDMQRIKKCKYNEPFMTYIYGKENYEAFKTLGFECKLLSKKPLLWKAEDEVNMYVHKLEIMREALNDYDEIIFMDWDTVATRRLPKKFWQSFYKKDSFQAALRAYRGRGCFWRTRGVKARPCASFVYIRGKEPIQRIMEIWEENKSLGFTEELAMAMYTDELTGGWQNSQTYWERFEVDYFLIPRHNLPRRVYSMEKRQSKNLRFLHYNRRFRSVVGRMALKADDEEGKTKIISDFLHERTVDFAY